MKKYIVLGLMVFFTVNSFTQTKKMLGDWKENYRSMADTTTTGDISFRKILPEDGYGSYTIKITQDLGFFWLAWGYESDFVKKIIYDPKKNNFVLTKVNSAQGDLVIEYDKKNDHLVLIDGEKRRTMYEFSRK